MGMKLLIAAAAAASALALAAPASASTYVNLAYGFIDDSDVQLGAIGGRFGWRSMNPLGVEAEASFGIDDQTKAGVKYELNSQFAVYGTATGVMTDNLEMFARFGFGTQSLKASGSGVSVSDNFNSWNLGAGVNWFITPNDGVRADYTRVMFTDDGIDDDNVWSIGWVHRFK
jgi:hypothetical protein